MVMNSSLKLVVVSAFLFLMLWFAYETKPQEITLNLMCIVLLMLVVSVVGFGFNTFWYRIKRW